MTRPSTTTIPVIATVVCFSGLVITAIVGTSPGLAGLGLAVAVSAGLVAALSWRNARTVGAARLATANWWKFLVGGGGVLATIAIATTITGEVSSGLWLPLMLTMLASIVTLALGVILGIAHLTRRAHPRTS